MINLSKGMQVLRLARKFNQNIVIYFKIIDLHNFNGYLPPYREGLIYAVFVEVIGRDILTSCIQVLFKSVFLLFLFLKFSFTDKPSLHLIVFFSLSVYSATIQVLSGVFV